MMTTSSLTQLFSRARDTTTKAQARRHDSRAFMCMKRTSTLANKGSRKRKPHKLMLKIWRTLETRLIVQQCAQQHILLNYVCMQTKKGAKTVEFLPKEPRIPENMVGTKNTNNCETRISSTPAEHDRGLYIQFVTKTSTSLAK